MGIIIIIIFSTNRLYHAPGVGDIIPQVGPWELTQAQQKTDLFISAAEKV